MSGEGDKPPSKDKGSPIFFVLATTCVLLHVFAACVPQLILLIAPLLLLASVCGAVFIIAAFRQASRRDQFFVQAVLLLYGFTILICWAVISSSVHYGLK